MTLLSLFMTSTGIFCFVPISHRLIESGIVLGSNDWRFRRLPSVLAPTLYDSDRAEDRLQFLLPAKPWSDAEMPLYPAEDAFATSPRPVTSCANEWGSVIISPLQGSPTHSFLHSTPTEPFYGRESTSFTSDTSLCDSCNTLLRREIPPDHIPSVIRALALFEAQDRLSDVGFNELELAALTNAFSMLHL